MIMIIPAPEVASPSVSEVKIENKWAIPAIVIKRIIAPVTIYSVIRVISVIAAISKIKSGSPAAIKVQSPVPWFIIIPIGIRK
jgi:hypothetical protein